jgi:hypothetical protein
VEGLLRPAFEVAAKIQPGNIVQVAPNPNKGAKSEQDGDSRGEVHCIACSVVEANCIQPSHWRNFGLVVAV